MIKNDPQLPKRSRMNAQEKPPEPNPDRDSQSDSRKLIRSDELLAGSEEVLIEHEGQTYRLRVTRSGKLILHK